MENTNNKGKQKANGDVSFLVRVLFRRNANHQGIIHWMEKNKKISFRSALELMMLMQEAMNQMGTENLNCTFRSWKCDHLEDQKEYDKHVLSAASNEE